MKSNKILSPIGRIEGRYENVNGEIKADIMICAKVSEKFGTLLSCNGEEVSREEFKELFELIGTKFGEGDGKTTFNLPNLVQ